jgi:hypothetical protein
MLPVVERQRKMFSRALVRTRHKFNKSRRTGGGEPPTSATDLQTMTVAEIAQYLRDHSTFGMRQRAKLSFKELVEFAIAWELRRAGRDGEIRFVAQRVGTDVTEEIDPSFWRLARFADDGIWSRPDVSFVEALHPTPLAAEYRHGRAPLVDVLRTWPRASIFRKAWTAVYVFAKIHWYLFLSFLRKFF